MEKINNLKSNIDPDFVEEPLSKLKTKMMNNKTVHFQAVNIAAPPRTNGISISCVRFLTNYGVGERFLT